MKSALQIVWKGLDPSEALSERINHLAREAEPLDTCRVVVEVPHHHRQRGCECQVKAEAMLDGRRYVGTSADDPYVAVNGAFDSLRRQLDARGPKLRAVLRRARRAVR